jgi:hypothetical protein
MKTYVHLWQYHVEFFLELQAFLIKVVEKIKTHVLCPITIFRKSCRLWENVEKYRAGEATYDNMAHARCNLCK